MDITLTQTGSNWTLTDRDDITETYATVNLTEARLSSSRSRNGYTQTLSYGTNQTTVTDSYGRSLVLNYLNGLLQTVTTPENTLLTYGYGSSGLNPGTKDRLSTVTYSTSPQTTQTYLYENAALSFALTGVTDEDGNRYATWAYDAFGRAVSNYMGSSTTQANVTTIQYDDTTGNRTVTNALGESELYKFATLQGIPKLTEIDRQATATTAAASRLFTYDTNGYLASQTDWDGNQTNFANNVHGQPTSIIEAASTPQTRTTSIAYDPTFIHLPKEIARPGITTDFAYDGNGNVLTRTVTDTTTAPYSTKGQTRVSTFTWNSYGLPATTQNPRTDLNATMHYSYDSTFALAKITNPLGQSIQITSNSAGGRPQIIVDANGVTTQLSYDARQRLTSRAVSTAAGTLTTSFGYDAASNLIKTTLPDGSFLMNTYDTAHRLTNVTDALGNYTKYTLDGMGDRTQTSVYQSSGTVTSQASGSFDALGRELVHTAGAGQTTTKTYDANGNVLTVKDGLSHTTTNTYDALNHLATSTDANGGVTTPGYDTNDRIVNVIDANGNTTAYVRDGFGEVTQQTSPDSGVSVFHYDGDGNLISKTDALGIVTNQTFDALDRPLTTTYPAHTAENVAYTYDQTGAGFSFGIGRLTSVTDAAGALTRKYEERGNLVTEARVNGATTLTTGYTYDGANRIASMTYPDGTLVGYQHDAAGYVSKVTAKLPGATTTTTLANLTHQPFGPINGATFGNGVAETWTFDQAYRPTNITDALSAKNLQNLTYGYDAADNVKTITDAVNATNSQTFGYDPVNRLTTATSGTGGYGGLTWTYDKVGNRLTQVQGTTTTSYGYTPGTNRLLTIAPGAAHARLKPFLIRKTQLPTGGDFWANAPPNTFPGVKPSRNLSLPQSSSTRFATLLGWPLLLTGFAGIFSLRRRLRTRTLPVIVSFAFLLSGSATLLSGCIASSEANSTPDSAIGLAVTGEVHGGQQPVAGASIQLYAVGTTGDGSAATPLFHPAVQTTAAGNFTFPTYTCPSSTTQVYLVATGGNPGFAGATNNTALALMAALGPCGSMAPSTYVSVNELTTVGSIAALYPYMSSATGLGSGSADAAQLTAAFSLVNQYTNTATGAVPGLTLPAGYYASSIEIKTLSNIIATCINSIGGTAGDSTPCGTLFSLTSSGGSAPTDTIAAVLNILKNPGQNVLALYNLAGPAAPFQPSLNVAPASWSLPILTLPAAPIITPIAGTYGAAQTVTLAGATSGATIYYTTDGSTPTTSSAKYTGSLTVASTETISAIAAINSYVVSSVATAAYVISGTTSAINVVTNANGNITDVPSTDGVYYLHFTYNNANRPASVTGGAMAATFVYDWAGQRISKTNGGTPASVYSYSQDGAVIAESDAGVVTNYIYADGRPIAVLQPSATPAASQVNYVTADRLGTPQVLTNSSGGTVWSTNYQPFGTTGPVTASVNQNLRFPGQIADAETGFSYNLTRNYMPNLGRYLESDSIGLAGGSNTYSYATDNPLTAVDRTGTDTSYFFGIPPNLPVPDMSQVPPWKNPFDPGLPSIKLPRTPDAYTLTITGGEVAGGGIAWTVDAYGNIYVSVVIIPTGLPNLDPIAISLFGTYYGSMYTDRVTEKDLENMISGPSVSYGGGAILGCSAGSPLNKGTSDTAFGDVSQSFGATTPGFSQQIIRTFLLP